MKRNTIIFAAFLLLCGRSMAQTPVPLSAVYIACAGTSFTVGFQHDDNIKYYWFMSANGTGTQTPNGQDQFSYTKNVADEQTIYAEPRYWNGTAFVAQTGGNGMPVRIPVVIHKSEICGETDEDYANEASGSCYVTGQLLFKQDFGGNEPTDPFVLPNQAAVNASGILHAGEQVAPGWTYDAALCGWGVYSIGKQTPAAWYNNCRPGWSSIDDHTYYENDPPTPQRGYFISFEAAETTGIFYEMQIDQLCVGTKLTFTSWVRSFHKNQEADSINLIFRVYDMANNELATYFTGNIPDGNGSVPPPWRNYGFPFTTPTSSVKVKIYNNGGTYNGNDFGMDDIQVHLCVDAILLDAQNIKICEGQDTVVRINYTNNGTFLEPLEYQWYYSQTGDMSDLSTWTATSHTTSSLSLPNVTAADTGYYYVALAGAGGINLDNCRATSPRVHIGLKDNIEITRNAQICTGSNYDFYGTPLTATGQYQHTVPMIGCDSVITLNLSVSSTIQIDEDLEICASELPRTWRGHELPVGTSSQVFHYSGTTPAGCATDTTLNLTVNQSATENTSLTICSTELPYRWRNDTTFQVGTTSRMITMKRQAANGCDSIINLNLIVRQATEETIEITICDSELPYTWRGHEFPVGSVSQVYPYNETNIYGCDSIVELNLIINDCNVIILEVEQIGDLCSVSDIVVRYSLSGAILDCYTVTFNRTGFPTISCQTPNANSTIEITIPANVRPDNYEMKIDFQYTDGTIETRILNFLIRYPSWIIEQNWEDVIALLNPQAITAINNANVADYTFASYQWHKSDQPIKNETGSYLYIENGKLDFTACYTLELTRVGENYSIFTCPLCPVHISDVSPLPQFSTSQGILRINNIAQNGTVKIWTVAGILIGTQQISADNPELSIQLPSGMYIMQITMEDGIQKAFKIVI